MIEYIFLVPLVLLGVASSYTDITNGIIKNRHIIYAIYGGILTHIIVILVNRTVSFSGYFHYFTNSAFMLLISFIFWNVGLWTAGDAKLFFAFNFLTPPIFIVQGYMGMFYGVVYFTNIFGILLLYFTYKVFRKISMREFKTCLKETLEPKILVMLAVFMFAFGSIMEYIPQPQPTNFLTSSLVFFIIILLLRRFAKQHMMRVIVLMAILRLFTMDIGELLTLDFWIMLISQLLMLLVLMFLLLRASFYAFTRKVRLEELEEKMMIAEDIVPKEKSNEGEEGHTAHKGYKKKKIENLTIFAYLMNEPFEFENYNKNLGLSKENLEWIGKNRKRLRFSSIRVYETMSFAPFIFAGVLGTILVQGNIFIHIARIFTGN